MNGNVLEMSMNLCLMTIKIIQMETGEVNIHIKEIKSDCGSGGRRFESGLPPFFLVKFSLFYKKH